MIHQSQTMNQASLLPQAGYNFSITLSENSRLQKKQKSYCCTYVESHTLRVINKKFTEIMFIQDKHITVRFTSHGIRARKIKGKVYLTKQLS